ncbi:MAG: hypothetical protein ACYDDB_07745 [bacterium]
MDKRKLCGKRRKKLKPGERRRSFQEFIDDIGNIIEERKELEDLFKRVLIFDSEKVMEEMEIKKKNNELLQAHMLIKAGESRSKRG